MATNPNCPPNTSNLTELPHFFASLRNDYFRSFPSSSSLSHSPHLVTSLHVSWSKYKPSHRKSLIFYHQIYKPPCISTNFLLFPSLEMENVSFLLLEFKPCFGGSCLCGLLKVFTLSSTPLSPIPSGLYLYPAVSISLKIHPSIYF